MYQPRTEAPRRDRNDLATIKSLLPYLWNYRGRVLLAVAFLILAKIATVGVPLALKEIVDALDTSQLTPQMLPLGLLLAYGALRLTSSLFNELRDVVFARVRHGTMRDLSLRMLDHLHRLSLRFHLERKTGALARDMERGTRSASSLLNYLLFNILPTLVELTLVATILLANYNPWYAIITLISVAGYAAFTFYITEWRMKYRRLMNLKDGEANAIAIDSLINFETVKYFGNERYEHRRYGRLLGEWEDAAVTSQTSMSWLNIGQGAFIAIGVTIIMILATHEVIAGTMSLGDLVLVNAFLLQVFIPLGFLGVVYSQLKHALSDMEQMFQLLDTHAEITDSPNARPLPAGPCRLRFNQVAFAYHENRPILHDISFTLPAGRKIAIVGASGAGKSTLARLLFRFYDVTAGAIEINGVDIRQLQQQSLRAAIAIVPQDTVLFNDTIGNNIAYGCPDASEAEIVEAARLANIDPFIRSLPDGYATVVGERGLKLSGGERQRVAIARAILKRPRILIFDEATSALDSHSEQAILSELRQMAADHTTLVIAHRLSTISDADEILVMRDGQIVERGTHSQLIAASGLYNEMWLLQERSTESNSTISV
jgi:ATP-binding cassette, subfamily B, heavy metal transporter